ncbi:MAG: hypothetical protein WC712_05435 [Candidatus Brocadiia bacterium]
MNSKIFSLILVLLTLLSLLSAPRARADESDIARVFKALPDSPSQEDASKLYKAMLASAALRTDDFRNYSIASLLKMFSLPEFEPDYYNSVVMGKPTEEDRKWGRCNCVVKSKSILLHFLFVKLALEAPPAEGAVVSQDLRRALAMKIYSDAVVAYQMNFRTEAIDAEFAKLLPGPEPLYKWRDQCVEAKLATLNLPPDGGIAALDDWKKQVDALDKEPDADTFSALCLWFWRNIKVSEILPAGLKPPVAVEGNDTRYSLYCRILSPSFLPDLEHWRKDRNGRITGVEGKAPLSVTLTSSLAVLMLLKENAFAPRFRSRLRMYLLEFPGTYDMVRKEGIRMYNIWLHSSILPTIQDYRRGQREMNRAQVNASRLKKEAKGTDGPPACFAGMFVMEGENGKQGVSGDFLHPIASTLVAKGAETTLLDGLQDVREFADFIGNIGWFRWEQGYYRYLECDYITKTEFPKPVELSWDYSAEGIQAMLDDGRMAKYFKGVNFGPVLKAMTPALVPKFLQRRVYYQYPRTDWALYTINALHPQSGKPFYTYPDAFLVLYPPKDVQPVKAEAGYVCNVLGNWLGLSGIHFDCNRIWNAKECEETPVYKALNARMLEVIAPYAKNTKERWDEGKAQGNKDAYEEWGE